MGSAVRHTQPAPRAAQPRPSAELLRRQVSALDQLDCLHGAAPEALERLAPLGALRAFAAGEQLLHEGEAAAFLHLVLRGTVRLTLHDRAKHEVLVGILNRGDCFGEGPLFGDLFRGATVQTETICYMLQIPLGELRPVLAEQSGLEASLRRIYRQRKVEWSLGRVPLFSQLSPLERSRIALLLQPRSYARGELIMRAGEPGQALALIESGQALVERGDKLIAHLDEGNFCGEMALLSHEPHNADVRALTPVETLELPAGEFARLLKQQPALAATLQEVVERRRVANMAQGEDARTQQLAHAVERGMLRGSYLLVRDHKLCDPHCRRCEDACAARFGHARIRAAERLLNGLEITDACRQCRVGAECLEVCPEQALEWNDQGALVVNDRCNGCGACVAACPYDAVELVPRDGEQGSLLTSLWQRMRRAAMPQIPLEPARASHRANKCDLCHGHEDHACVSACPTGALRLVPVEELFPL
jgi:CRP-like cAMP-binding protein/Fe-S-cluster-containing hydrogenase component 2